jgi:hypothetical protein
MKFPGCTTDLVMTERSGVEIDYCPQCRGVWLDRGELEKLIDRSPACAGNAQPENRAGSNTELRPKSIGTVARRSPS